MYCGSFIFVQESDCLNGRKSPGNLACGPADIWTYHLQNKVQPLYYSADLFDNLGFKRSELDLSGPDISNQKPYIFVTLELARSTELLGVGYR